ncbi:MAG: bifunctional oligoribonuclease/PAP phosphatase NrnA [Candidatus Falkowbacteria bacterium]
MPEEKFKLAWNKIQAANKILLVTHKKPDGDALGSICALSEILESKKNYDAFCGDAPSAQFDFLPHIEKIRSDRNSLDFFSYNLIVVLDCGGISRTGLEKEILNRRSGQYVIEFDHHPKMDDYADLEIRLPKSSSTAEVLHDFLKTNGIKPNKNVANCLLAGILIDTGNFLYPSTSDKTVKIGAAMLSAGARLPTIIENTWRNKNLPGMKFWGKAIDNLSVNKKYNFAYTVLTHEDIARSGATEEEFDGIAGFLSNLCGVNGLLVLREEADGRIKGSLRTTHPTVDISKLAKILGGGGHAKASGFVMEGRIENAGQGWRVV